jgi:hypothetical protein
VLLQRLTEGDSLQSAQDEVMAALMAHLLETRITEQMMQRLQA